MLAVDGNDLAAAPVAHRRDHRAAGDEALLVGQREALAVLERRQRGRQAGEADDRVEHDVDVGMRGQLGQHLRCIGTQAGRRERHAELGGLRVEQLAVAGRRQRDDLVLVAVVPDDVERLRADRAGRPEDGDPPHQERPSATDQVVDRGQAEQHRVEAVEHTAVTGEERAEVLEAEVALEHRLHEVAERGEDRHDDAEQQAVAERVPRVQAEDHAEDGAHDHRRRHATDEALDRLVGRDVGHQRAVAHAGADEVAGDVVGHRAERRGR